MTVRRQLVPDVVSDQRLVTLKKSATARDAAVLMDKKEVSSVLVVKPDGRLRGIFTVRDVARRIVGNHLDPDRAKMKDVMTRDVTCVRPDETPQGALRIMQDGHFRHLPITKGGKPNGKVLGVVSRRDFFPEEEALLKFEEHLWEEIR